MPNIIGQSIERYRILEQVGEGGMAVVYKAHDARLERDVAIKIIRRELFGQTVIERILKRFEREAKALARLSHPNIVRVIDYGEYRNSPYLVLEYLCGGTLKDRLGKPMPWQKAAQILTPVARALEYAHEHQVIHRDVKPSNILLSEKGLPMLTDFGIAKLLETEETQTLTGTGMGVGTPEYMSPEQALGKEVDGRTDIYSLGIILYEMVTARKPYIADTPLAVVLKQVSDPLPKPSIFAPDLPPRIEQLLVKVLAKSPDDRFENANAFAIALEELQTNPKQAKDRSIRTSLKHSDHMTDTMATIVQPPKESTVDQLESTSEISASIKTRRVNRTRSASKTKLERPFAHFVFVIVEDGIPLYQSLPSSNNWRVWLGKGTRLTIAQPIRDALASLGKYGHYIEVTDKNGNEGYVAATAVSVEQPRSVR